MCLQSSIKEPLQFKVLIKGICLIIKKVYITMKLNLKHISNIL